jgi:cytoskeletal protein CcmA (bactofilin family)
MFTIRPPKKNGGNGNGNGHKPGIGGNGNGNGKNGHGSAIETVLGPGVHHGGTLSGAGGVRIEGAFDGEIRLKGALVIGEGAKVTAEIQAGVVSVAGTVKGNITAGKVEILSSGRVYGDLITASFASEDGAFFRGTVRMEEEAPEPAVETAGEPAA